VKSHPTEIGGTIVSREVSEGRVRGNRASEEKELIDFKELPRGVSESRPCINAYHVDLLPTHVDGLPSIMF